MKPSSCALRSFVVTILLTPVIAQAQGTLADYERANNLRKTFQDAAVNVADRATAAKDRADRRIGVSKPCSPAVYF